MISDSWHWGINYKKFDTIRNMKILVTGGCGFIASNIIDGYIKKGFDVVAIDNLSSGKKENLNPKAKFYRADVRDSREIRKIISEEKPEIINHHAAQISVTKSVSDPLEDAEINIIGCIAILEEARRCGVKKIIFASSGGVVYGDVRTFPVSEGYSPAHPVSPYGVSKLACEHYLFMYHKLYGLPYIALRYSNVYGPRQNATGEAGVVAIFTTRYLKDEEPVIHGDGKQTRDYVYVGDVVSANLKCLDTDFTGAVNIGTGIETDVNAISETIRLESGAGRRAVHGPEKKGEIKRSCLDNTLAGKVLGWKPQVTLRQGIGETVRYFRDNSMSS